MKKKAFKKGDILRSVVRIKGNISPCYYEVMVIKPFSRICKNTFCYSRPFCNTRIGIGLVTYANMKNIYDSNAMEKLELLHRYEFCFGNKRVWDKA